MLKFTNAHTERRGDVIYINKYHISAVYEEAEVKGGSLTTKVFGGHTGIVWSVEESLSEVLSKINQ